MHTTNSNTTAPSSEFRYGWHVVAAAVVGVARGASPVPDWSIGPLIGPIRDELGWAVGDISLAITIYGITAACMAPIVGSLADRFCVGAADRIRLRPHLRAPAADPGTQLAAGAENDLIAHLAAR